MNLFGPGIAQGILQGQQAMRDQADQEQALAAKKQQMEFLRLQNEQQQQAAAATLRNNQYIGQTLAGPPPLQPSAPGQPSVSAPAITPYQTVAGASASNAPSGGQPTQPMPPPPLGGPQGLDLSKVPMQQQIQLAKQDPQAFSAGVSDFEKSSQGQPPAQFGQSDTPAGPPPLQAQVKEAFSRSPEEVYQRMKAAGVPPEDIGGAMKQYFEQFSGAFAQVHSQALEQAEIKREAQAAADAAYKKTVTERTQTRLEKSAGEKSTVDSKRLEIAGQKVAQGAGSAMDREAVGAAMASGQPPRDIVGYTAKAKEYAFSAGIDYFVKYKGLTPAEAGVELGRVQQEYKATTSTLTAVEKRAVGIEGGIREIKNDIKTLDDNLNRVAAKGGAKILNVPLNKLREQLSSEEYSQLNLMTTQVATKYERLLNGGILSVAQLHTGAAEDAKKLLNGDMTPSQIRAIIPIMQTEMDNSLKAQKETKAELVRPGGSKPSAAKISKEDQDLLDKYK